MDGGRRRRRRSGEDASNDVRASWYAWWRSARFACHFGGRARPTPERFREQEGASTPDKFAQALPVTAFRSARWSS